MAADDEQYMRKRWTQAARPAKVPVIALEHSPGAVPAAPQHRALQSYIPMAPSWQAETNLFVRENLPRPYLAVHLRLHPDWQAHCVELDSTPEAAAAAAAFQCVPSGDSTSLPRGLCYPDVTALQQLVRRAIRRFGARSVYVATDMTDADDVDALNLVVQAANEALVDLHGGSEDDAVVLRMGLLADDPIPASAVGVMRDLGVLVEADVAILNCVSSFSSFVARERDVRPRGPTLYWGRPLPAPARQRQEL